MPSLYNCKHSGDQYKITKFDSDFNVEASYLLDADNCECPAGHRPSCRHRSMLPKFIQRDYVGKNWFLDFDRGGWVQGWKEEPAEVLEEQLVASAALLKPSCEPSDELIIEPKTFNEVSHEHDEEQLAFYREAAKSVSVGDGSSPSVAAKGTIRRRV